VRDLCPCSRAGSTVCGNCPGSRECSPAREQGDNLNSILNRWTIHHRLNRNLALRRPAIRRKVYLDFLWRALRLRLRSSNEK
jgi:hypothetical protein